MLTYLVIMCLWLPCFRAVALPPAFLLLHRHFQNETLEQKSKMRKQLCLFIFNTSLPPSIRQRCPDALQFFFVDDRIPNGPQKGFIPQIISPKEIVWLPRDFRKYRHLVCISSSSAKAKMRSRLSFSKAVPQFCSVSWMAVYNFKPSKSKVRDR